MRGPVLEHDLALHQEDVCVDLAHRVSRERLLAMMRNLAHDLPSGVQARSPEMRRLATTQPSADRRASKQWS
jgi:hypothetical protein